MKNSCTKITPADRNQRQISKGGLLFLLPLFRGLPFLYCLCSSFFVAFPLLRWGGSKQARRRAKSAVSVWWSKQENVKSFGDKSEPRKSRTKLRQNRNIQGRSRFAPSPSDISILSKFGPTFSRFGFVSESERKIQLINKYLQFVPKILA